MPDELAVLMLGVELRFKNRPRPVELQIAWPNTEAGVPSPLEVSELMESGDLVDHAGCRHYWDDERVEHMGVRILGSAVCGRCGAELEPMCPSCRE